MKLGTKHPLLKGTEGFTNKEHSIIKKEMIDFSCPNQRYDIIIALSKCVYWLILGFLRLAMWPMGLLLFLAISYCQIAGMAQLVSAFAPHMEGWCSNHGCSNHKSSKQVHEMTDPLLNAQSIYHSFEKFCFLFCLKQDLHVNC